LVLQLLKEGEKRQEDEEEDVGS